MTSSTGERSDVKNQGHFHWLMHLWSLAGDGWSCTSWLGSTHHPRRQRFCALCCLLADAADLFLVLVLNEAKAPGRRRECCCVINGEGFDIRSDAIPEAPPRTNVGPILHAASRATRAFMRGLFWFACLSRICVCSVSPLWKMFCLLFLIWY